jgi:3-hydroxymyristoyl/3-hydroxydecanoyl-(acyl carrier protein) dehydratase
MTEVERWIPHRHPFLFVDRVDAVGSAGLRASWWVDPAHPYVVGTGVLPSVLVIEALAQATRLFGAMTRSVGDGRVLGSIEAEVCGPVPAGCRLDLVVHDLRPIGTATRAVCEASVAGVIVVRAVIVAVES